MEPVDGRVPYPADSRAERLTRAHTSHRRHHFVRDGEVRISLVHHDDGAGTNKLDAARQALREQTTAREHAEQLLHETRATIQTLETQLAHERIAKEEAVRQVEDQRQRVVDELAAERVARQQAEQERDEATAGRQEAGGRLREVMATQEGGKAARVPRIAGRGRKTVNDLDLPSEVSDAVPADDAMTVKQARRRGRPPKASDGVRHCGVVGAGVEGAAQVAEQYAIWTCTAATTASRLA